MQRLECGKLFDGCEGVVEGATNEDVLAQASEHVRQAHGIERMDEATVAAATREIETV